MLLGRFQQETWKSTEPAQKQTDVDALHAWGAPATKRETHYKKRGRGACRKPKPFWTLRVGPPNTILLLRKNRLRLPPPLRFSSIPPAGRKFRRISSHASVPGRCGRPRRPPARGPRPSAASPAPAPPVAAPALRGPPAEDPQVSSDGQKGGKTEGRNERAETHK